MIRLLQAMPDEVVASMSPAPGLPLTLELQNPWHSTPAWDVLEAGGPHTPVEPKRRRVKVKRKKKAKQKPRHKKRRRNK